jgi:1-acyl-sn-glycerol-3-phosphate acyltransferase
MIRFILCVLFVVFYLIISVPILLVETLIRKFISREAAELSMLRIAQVAFKIVLFLAGVKLTTLGQENIPENEAVLFVANHQSIFDCLIAYSQMKTRCGFIAKDNLARIPLLSWNMRFLLCLFLDRSDAKKGLEVIKKAISYIGEGISVFIYPEGTRNRNEDETELLPFHRGSFKVAQRSGCAIVPVAFNNAGEIFERHFPKVKGTHVIVEYGKPIPYGDLSREEQKHIDDYFRDMITEMVKKNRALV